MSSETGKARLCHITKWDHFDGYGFDLHAEKGKPGQFIGKVDEGSPAEAAGLRQGDRIIEVNGSPIEGKTHRDVVDLIKTVPKETKLLVVSDAEPTTSETPTTPPKTRTTTDGGGGDSKERPKIETNGNEKSNKPANNANNITNNNLTNGVKPTTQTTITNGTEKTEKAEKNEDNEDRPHPQENGANPAPQGGATGLNLNMTAAELRARLAAKKKFDPKKESTMDFKKKFDMIQKL